MLKYRLKVEVRADGREIWTADLRVAKIFWAPVHLDYIDHGCRSSREDAFTMVRKHAQNQFNAGRELRARKIVDRATICQLQVREGLDGKAAITSIVEMAR